MIRRCLLSVITFVLFTSSVSHAQTYIFGSADFTVGNSPNAIVTGDFNGDGVPDLAVTNNYDNTISILLGRRTGGFAPQVTYPTGPLPVGIVAGDFNGDGNLDLAVTNGNCTPGHQVEPPQCSPSTVSILMGNGDGTFQPQVTYPVGTLPASIVTADFNGDGKLDLAVVNVDDNDIGILLGNGDGTFQPQVTYPVSVGIGYFFLPSLVLGDFNGDGNVDLAVGDLTAVFVLLGNGNGTFQSALQSTPGGYEMAVGDFNGDGIPDLVVTGGENDGVYGTFVLLGLGNGTFYLNATYPLAVDVAVADLNGDGKLDLVTTTSTTFTVQLGNGNGTFGSPVSYGTGSGTLILADLNGDGKLDVASVVGCGVPCSEKPTLPGTVSVALGFGDGTFVGSTAGNPLPSPALLNGATLAADFANNGVLDIVDAPGNPTSNTVTIAYGNGSGAFPTNTTLTTATGPAAVAAGDLRNNGDLDLVSANSPCTSTSCPPGTVSVLLGNGNGTFQTHVDYPVGVAPSGIALGSFVTGGPLDIAVSNSNQNTVSILLGNGDGTFQSQVTYPTNTNPQQVAVGDFNNDGNLDLAIATQNGASVLLGNGDGTFQSQVTWGGSCTGIVAADFNGDGNLDLLLTYDGELLSELLLGNGNGTFQAPISLPFSGSSLAAVDFNGDGKLDVAFAVGAYNPDAFIALGNGDGTFQPPSDYLMTPTFVWALTVGDFNGDGVPDFAAIDQDGNFDVMLSVAFKNIAPGSLNFGFQGVGTTSVPQTITLSNPSNVQFNLTSIAASGNFAQTNTCGASLTVGANCSITVTFTPTTTGQQSGAITITDSTRISPVAVPLSGNGVSGSFLTPYPSLQNFSTQAIGSSSAAAAIQLVNTGNAALTITSISITGTNSSDFSETNTCGSSLAAGASCTANVTFTPQAAGSLVATLSISDTATGSPQSATLAGTGLGPTVTLAPNLLTFSSQAVGTTSSPQVVTLTNTGNVTLNFTSIAISTNFAQTNTCGASLSAGASCQVSVTFTPTSAGNLTGSVTITDSAANSPQTIPLSGVAVAPFTLAPASGSPSSQTIPAGQSAKFSLVIAPASSFSGTVNLGCSISPKVNPAPTCNLSSSSVTLSGGANQTVTVTVATTAATSGSVLSYFDFPPNLLPLGLLAAAFLGMGFCLTGRRHAQILPAAIVVLLTAFWSGCGSSSGSTTPGTPSGTYTATVTATSGTASSSVPLTVIVQ